MASWQAHVLNFVVYMQIKRRLKGAMDLEYVRRVLAGRVMPPPAGVTCRPDTVGGVAGEWVEATGPRRGILLYLHGGGYFACSPATHRPITIAFAQNGFAVFAPDYRLAPEHPYPAAIEDAVAVWHGLVERGHAPKTLTVAGDSAGGGLALAMLLSLRDENEALPAAAALLSPWTDLAVAGASVASNARREVMFTREGLLNGGALYLNGADRTAPLVSPVNADFAGFPPLAIHVGEREMLRDDSTRVAERARAAGVAVDLLIWPVVPHVWQLAPFVPEARESVRLLAGFLGGHVECVGAKAAH